MRNKENKKMDIKALMPVIIPLIAAVLVVVALAVSGHIAKNNPVTPELPVQQSSQPAVNETKSTDSKVTLVAVGDNLIHNTLVTAGKQEDGTLKYNSFYDNISSVIKAADIACINQETMLGGKAFEYSGYPLFNTPWEVGEAAIDAGFDVFTCATNHSLDMGSAGIEKELEFFDKHKEVTHIGTNASQEDYNNITYINKNDISFALLNYTYGTNGIPIPEDKSYIVNMLDEEKVKKDITEARKNADVVIVFPHWGTENSHDVSQQQEKYVKIFSDLGVDIVIGAHPHVLQEVEWVENQESGKKMLVYYSLGNFISHQTNLNQLCGGMAEITVERKDGEISITNAKLAPVVCHYKKSDKNYSFSVYKLADYTQELGDSHVQDGATPEYFTELSKKVVSEEFLDLN